MSLDNKAIEILAVNAVKNSIVTSEYLDQFIAENDKEPTWDGFVYIYNDKSKKKSKLENPLWKLVARLWRKKWAGRESG